EFGVGNYPQSLVAGDLNGDGRLDLAVANAGFGPIYGHTLSVLLGTGDDLALVDAHLDHERVSLTWFGSSLAGVTVTVDRNVGGSVWIAVASVTGDATGTFRFEDASLQPGVRYGYRLSLQAAGTETLHGETWGTIRIVH